MASGSLALLCLNDQFNCVNWVFFKLFFLFFLAVQQPQLRSNLDSKSCRSGSFIAHLCVFLPCCTPYKWCIQTLDYHHLRFLLWLTMNVGSLINIWAGRPHTGPDRTQTGPKRPPTTSGKFQTSPGKSQTSFWKPQINPGRPQKGSGRSQTGPERSQTDPGKPQTNPGKWKASVRSWDASDRPK